MKARRLTNDGLARRIASSNSGVSEWTRALRMPRLETLRRLSAEFDIPLEELEAMLPSGEVLEVTEVASARQLLAAEGYGGLVDVRVTTDDLTDRTPPIVRGMVVWIDPMIGPTPGRVVAVALGGQVLLRSLADDGTTLRSAVAPPLLLAAVDRVLGVGRLAQVPL
jgi:transcriptional regulator with XRE-family HTH domain